MPNVEIESELTIHYLDLNPNGNKVLLLLHGLGATGESWQLQFPALLEAGFRVLAPDMRGFGRSTFPGGSNNSEVMAHDMIMFLDHLQVENCHIIGISMGGTIAIQQTLIKPAMVNSLILTNTFAKLRPKKVRTWFFYVYRLMLLHTFGMQSQAKFVAKKLFPKPEQVELRKEFANQVSQANPDGYRSMLRSFARYDLSAQINKITVPTLIITGENDSVVPPAFQNELASQILNSRQIIIPKAGHAVSVEQPMIYNKIILDFLTNL